MRDIFRGGNRKKSKARREKRRLQKLIARQQQSYGRRPGRVDDIEQESKGYFAKLDEKPKDDACRI